uniref:Uncharacterized protein LOC104224737 n=1 Tax=Nicotiana sylvestris TaxID=4096 RepID=A0A1U7WKF2_NICSY|nr:PREDICTED: uncharacterized protein LOC104224737 [Nicotiana sylvestris]
MASQAVRALYSSPLALTHLIPEYSRPSLEGTYRDVARETVCKSLILLKKGKDPKKPFLPLDKNANKIIVTGNHDMVTSDVLREMIENEMEIVFEPNPTPETFARQDFSLAIYRGHCPVVLEPAQVDAFVAGLQQGAGISHMFFLEIIHFNLTWFKTVDQLPMHARGNSDPLFSFGFGLTT